MAYEDLMDSMRLSEQEERERPAQWQRAVDKLSIAFTADQRLGGYPDILRGLSEKECLALLRSLGFRVLERYEMEDIDTEPPKVSQWARLSGGIAVSLTDGYVNRVPGVRTK